MNKKSYILHELKPAVPSPATSHLYVFCGNSPVAILNRKIYYAKWHISNRVKSINDLLREGNLFNDDEDFSIRIPCPHDLRPSLWVCDGQIGDSFRTHVFCESGISAYESIRIGIAIEQLNSISMDDLISYFLFTADNLADIQFLVLLFQSMLNRPLDDCARDSYYDSRASLDASDWRRSVISSVTVSTEFKSSNFSQDRFLEITKPLYCNKTAFSSALATRSGMASDEVAG